MPGWQRGRLRGESPLSLWVLRWKGVGAPFYALLHLLPKLFHPMGMGQTVQSRKTEHPRNLQPSSQHRAVLLGRPRPSRHPNKVTGSLAPRLRLGRPAALFLGDPSPRPVRQIPKGRSQRSLRGPGHVEEATPGPRCRRRRWRGGRAPSPASAVPRPKPGTVFHRTFLFTSPLHHRLPRQATRSFGFQ